MEQARATRLNDFLRQNGWHEATRTPLAADASSRRYERVTKKNKSIIVMEDSQPKNLCAFVKVARALQETELSAPRIEALDEKNGFALLEDLGDITLRVALQKENEAMLYRRVVDGIIHLHRYWQKNVWRVPSYDMTDYEQEHQLLLDWHLRGWGMGRNKTMRREFFAIMRALLKPIVQFRARVPVLRDVHIDNLMWLPHREGLAAIGWLDFQDAAMGHPAFDVVSLLDDVRRPVSDVVKKECMEHYATEMNWDDNCVRHGETLSLQRLLKIAGIFVRLERRDGKTQYRQYLKQTWRDINRYLTKDHHKPLRQWFANYVPQYATNPPPLLSVPVLSHGMILAAGKGMRLRPVTRWTPKPLIALRVRQPNSVLACLVTECQRLGVTRLIINSRYRSDVMHRHTLSWRVTLSDESRHTHELHSGGGVVAALDFFADEPFYLLNGDSLWHENEMFPLLSLLAARYEPSMDGLLVLMPRDQTNMEKGDFNLTLNDGRVMRPAKGQTADYVFCGMQIVHPRLFASVTKGEPCRLNDVYDTAMARNCLHGLVFDGDWCHLSGLRDLWRMRQFLRRHF